MVEVKLTDYELQLCASVGIHRHIAAILSGKKDCHGFNGDGWGAHIEGAAGEMAFAKHSGRYWDGSVNTFKTKGDVGRIQVRTRSQHGYDLIIRENDSDDDVFVLVTGAAPSFRVVGWILGRDGKQQCWLNTFGNRPAAFFVPASNLKEIT